uniref:non-specific serine/threonine protein kinase n=1 Tax=Oryza brachyantha TaxID=4533 RepID=J3MDB3_ORYBR
MAAPSLLAVLLLPLVLTGSAAASSSSSSNNVSFDSAALAFSDLTLLGDSFLRNGSVGLTRDTGVPSSSAGSVLCSRAVAFGTGAAAAAAAEFGDPSGNHVGLDLGSPMSINAVDLAAFGVVLNSGNLTTAWIDYHGGVPQLQVSLSYSGAKPTRPVLSVAVDLSPYLRDAMYVGFSASTEGSTQQHTIKEWTFQTFGFPSATNSSSSFSNATSNASVPGEATAGGAASRKKRFGLAVSILGPVALAVSFVFFAWVSIKKLIELTSRKHAGILPELVKGPRKFSYKELSAATRGFHASRVIGKGAFGTVYKAAMPAGTAAASSAGATAYYAVKRSTQAHQSRSEFVAELSVIACLRHKNLVQLVGWCDDKGELLLVYEYMPNGSLDKALYGEPCTLSWPERYTVAAGIASVLSYLHQECEQRVIHRDIKTSNVLLDGNLSARLGDFGLARLMDHNKSPVSTLTAGTMGYLAPEYLQSGKATEQTDVFSYGVVLLEVCCGRRPIDKDDAGGKNVNLVDWVWRLHGEDRLIDAADPRLSGGFDRDEMLRLLLVGLSCANPNCDERPAMRRVVQILNREAEPVPVPRKKPLLVFSSTASMKLQEIAFACGDEVRGGLPAAAATSPKSDGGGDIER